MRPDKLTTEHLVWALRSMADEIERGASFQGSIDYDCLDEECAAGEFMVRATWRVGNDMGQGGMRAIGDLVAEPRKPYAPWDLVPVWVSGVVGVLDPEKAPPERAFHLVDGQVPIEDHGPHGSRLYWLPPT